MAWLPWMPISFPSVSYTHLRGMRLKELPGLETRPTTDKVKESVFNIVQFDVEGRRVLDLFGGTGQMLSLIHISCGQTLGRREAPGRCRVQRQGMRDPSREEGILPRL